MGLVTKLTLPVKRLIAIKINRVAKISQNCLRHKSYKLSWKRVPFENALQITLCSLIVEEYEILKTSKNTVIKKNSENNEKPHKPYADTIIR